MKAKKVLSIVGTINTMDSVAIVDHPIMDVIKYNRKVHIAWAEIIDSITRDFLDEVHYEYNLSLVLVSTDTNGNNISSNFVGTINSESKTLDKDFERRKNTDYFDTIERICEFFEEEEFDIICERIRVNVKNAMLRSRNLG